MSEPLPSGVPAAATIGREAEIAEVERALAHPAAGLVGLVLAGPAGIGKTTLLRLALERAGGAGRRVLLARPAESEAQLPFAGLADLLDDLGPDALAALPDPQRRALEVALRRADGDSNVDPLAISQAVLGVVRHLAASRPLAIALDDAPWLDGPTARVLEYAVRRLADEPVAVVATVRTADADAADAPLIRVLPRERLVRVEVGPLGVESIGRLVADRLGAAPPIGVAARIRELSGGNPMYAVEIARAMLRAGTAADPAEIPVPDSLGALVRDRLAQLSPEARGVALLAAAASRPTRALVTAALAGGAGPDPAAMLAEARASGVLDERPDGRLAFTHPLLAWAAYTGATAEQRLAAHARLAAATDDPDERVRHLAITAPAPDAGLAAELDAAAARAHARGAPETARDLELEALRFTEPAHAGDVRARTLAASELAIQAGDGRGARRLLERLIEATPPGPDRARPLARLADIRSGDDWEARLDLLRQAAAEAAPEGADRAEIELGIGVAHWMLVRDMPAGLAHARSAVRVAERAGDPAILLRAIGALSFVETFAGEPGTLARLEAARAQEARTPGIRLLFTPSYNRALALWWLDRPAEAAAAWREIVERADRLGDVDSRPLALLNLAEVEARLGRWAEADRILAEGEIAADLLGHDATRAFAAAYRARFEAHRGDVERCRAAAAHGTDLARRTHARMVEMDCATAVAELELSLGDAAAAAVAVGPAAEHLARAGVPHSPGLPVVALAAEAAALAGDVGEAERFIERLRVVGERLDHPSTLRAHHRARALLAARRGDLDEALAATDAALAEAERAADPFEQARTLLVHAEVLRRLRQRASAREAAAAAVAIFERLGARLWVERARSELARAGGPAGGPEALTPTQREVAGLVAAGRTNREVADALFMSPHTVEAHLTTIYRALGIRSRTDLARVLAAGAPPTTPAGEAAQTAADPGDRAGTTRGSRDIAGG